MMTVAVTFYVFWTVCSILHPPRARRRLGLQVATRCSRGAPCYAPREANASKMHGRAARRVAETVFDGTAWGGLLEAPCGALFRDRLRARQSTARAGTRSRQKKISRRVGSHRGGRLFFGERFSGCTRIVARPSYSARSFSSQSLNRAGRAARRRKFRESKSFLEEKIDTATMKHIASRW